MELAEDALRVGARRTLLVRLDLDEVATGVSILSLRRWLRDALLREVDRERRLAGRWVETSRRPLFGFKTKELIF
jgi:hypothetical protein